MVEHDHVTRALPVYPGERCCAHLSANCKDLLEKMPMSPSVHSMGAVQGTDVSSSADTGAQKSKNGVEWKSTADSTPNPKSPSLSKESIVPQRSQAVHDQPKAEDPHSKGQATAQACLLVFCQSNEIRYAF